MANKQESKYLRFISLMTLGVIVFICLISMACGMPVSTLSPVTVNKEVHIITPTLEPAPTPFRTDAESTSYACGSLWVRKGAGTEYSAAGWALKGDTLYRTDAEPRTLAIKDGGGTWVQVIDRDGMTGWVNQRFLCGGE